MQYAHASLNVGRLHACGGVQHTKAVCCAIYEADQAGGPVKVADVLDGKVSIYQDEISDCWGI